VESNAGAGADLVAEDEGGQELRAVGAILRLGEGEKRGEGAAADVPLGELVAVVAVESVDGHAARQRRAGGADGPAVEEHAGRTAAGGEVAGGVVPDDAGEIGTAAAGGDAEEVEEPAPGEGADLVGEVWIGQIVQEVGQSARGGGAVRNLRRGVKSLYLRHFILRINEVSTVPNDR
jgi:hypothetical protein